MRQPVRMVDFPRGSYKSAYCDSQQQHNPHPPSLPLQKPHRRLGMAIRDRRIRRALLPYLPDQGIGVPVQERLWSLARMRSPASDRLYPPGLRRQFLRGVCKEGSEGM